MNQPIKAVIFDAYGTLFDVAAMAPLVERFVPDAGDRFAALWREKQIDYTRLRTLSDRYADFLTVTGDALDYCCDRFAVSLSVSERDALMAAYAVLPPFAENRQALARIKTLGLPLGILTNGTRAMVDQAVAAAGFDWMFDVILSVDTVRRYKTAGPAYQLAPDALGCCAGEILFVSSNGWDAAAATWFGFHTFWVNRAAAPRERLGITPRAEGLLMGDVADYLEAWFKSP